MLKHFRRDLTNYLGDEAKKEAGKYFETYLYEDTLVTHCCELTPSYECWPVSFYTENAISDDTYDDLLIGLEREPIYVHCHVADRSATPLSYPFDRDEDESGEEYMERVVEYYQCNSYLVEAL